MGRLVLRYANRSLADRRWQGLEEQTSKLCRGVYVWLSSIAFFSDVSLSSSFSRLLSLDFGISWDRWSAIESCFTITSATFACPPLIRHPKKPPALPESLRNEKLQLTFGKVKVHRILGWCLMYLGFGMLCPKDFHLVKSHVPWLLRGRNREEGRAAPLDERQQLLHRNIAWQGHYFQQ